MSSIKLSEIDADWLAENVSGKVLLKAVGNLMGKKRAKKSGDGSSVGSREVSPAMQLHHERTSKIAELLRTFKQEVKDEEREWEYDLEDDYPKGAHLRVNSYLIQEGTVDEVIEAEDMDAIVAALNFLVENPDWKPEGKKPAKKAAAKSKSKSKSKTLDLSDSESDEEEAKPKAKAKAKDAKPAKKPAAKSKALDLSDSESEEEKPKAKPAAKPAEKPAEKPAAKPAKKPADSDSEEEKPKAKPAAKPAAKPKAKPADSDSEEEKPKPKAKAKEAKAAKGSAAAGAGGAAAGPRADDLILIDWPTLDKTKEYRWDQEGDGALYEGGKRVGTFDPAVGPTFDKA